MPRSWLPKVSARKAAFAVVSVFFGLVLALGACEIAVRLLTNTGPRLFVDRRYEPSFSGLVYDLESKQTVRFRTNSDGFRGPEHPIDKPAGALRVAVIGDSFVSAVSVSEEQTFVEQTARMLAEKTGRPVEALNFGVSGADPADYILFYRHFVAKYAPDLVICCFFHGNDLSDRFPELADSNRKYAYADYATPKFKGLKRFLGRHSRFYMWYEIKIRNVRDSLREWSREAIPSVYYSLMGDRFERRLEDYKVFLTDPTEKLDRDWRIVRDHLICLRGEVSANGSEFLLVGIPRAEQVRDQLWQVLSQEGGKTEGSGWSRWNPDHRLEQICTQAGIDYVPLLPRLREVPQDHDLYFGREHFNVEGHRLVADALTQAILSEPALARRANPGPSTR